MGRLFAFFSHIPVCLLLSFWKMSALCTTSVKYINKPRCNRIIYFHIHRDNCVTTVEKKKPHETAVYYMDAVEVVSFSVHVKIFDMPDAVRVFFAKKIIVCSHWFSVLPSLPYHSRKHVQLIRLIRFPCANKFKKKKRLHSFLFI